MTIISDPHEELVQVDTSELATRGFTDSGIEQFERTVRDYGRELYRRSLHLAEASSSRDVSTEVTHEQIRAAARRMAKTFGQERSPGWLVYSRAGEYVSVAVAGAGASHLDNTGGIVSFVIGVSAAVVLVVVRLTQGKSGD